MDSHKDHHELETSDSLYLKQLEYTDDVGKTWLNFFIKNFRVTVLIILGILIWGVISFQLLPLESSPEVKIPYGVVTVSLPGASPADMEEQIIEKIESKVSNLSGVKQVRSSASNSFASVTVEFRAEEDLKDALRRLRDAVDSVKSELPTDATEPVVTEISFSNTPIWTVVVTGPYDNFVLKKFAKQIEDELKKLPGTNDVLVSGGDVSELRISYDPKKLEQYGLSLDTVNNIIRANNISLPLGTLEVGNFNYTIKAEGKFKSAAELRDLPLLNSGGQLVRLRDVAFVVERAEERDVISRFSVEGNEPENAISLNVVKKTGSSIIKLIDDGKASIEELKATKFPADLKIETTLDYSEQIREDFNNLVRDGVMTFLLVTLVLFLFVGLKEAFVAGLAVPLVFAATFGLLNMLGITLNFLTMFSLILSLGLLVDDAIVVVQATKQYLKTGKFTPEEAVLLVFKDYKVVITATTLTTVWAFIPLVLSSGIIGEYIRSIPITTSITLISSYFIAIIINHPMAIILERFRVTRGIFWLLFGFLTILLMVILANMSHPIMVALALVVGGFMIALYLQYRRSWKSQLLHHEDMLLQERASKDKIIAKIRHHYEESNKKGLSRFTNGLIHLDRILPSYGKSLTKILRSGFLKAFVLIFALVLFVLSVMLPASGILKSEFLPPADSEYLYVNIKGPNGLISERTKEVADEVQKVLLAEKTIKTFSSVVGSPGVNTSGGLGASGSNTSSNQAQFAINLYKLDERPVGPNGKVEKSYEIAPRIRKAVEGINGATIDVVELAGGPPAGADFEARILGEDMKVLQDLAEKYKGLLSDIPGTINEKTSLNLSPGEFTFQLDPQKLALSGLTSSQVATVLRTALSGSEITKVLRDGDDLKVRAEFEKNTVQNLDDLRNLKLVNARGQVYFLGDIAAVEVGSSLTSISRIDEKRVVVLSAGVEQPRLPGEVLVDFQKILKDHPLPDGYEITFGGQNETNNESILSILRAMVLAMILIVATLVIQFNSFRKSILVLVAIPLALTGVFFGLTLIGFSLSFPGLIGVIALFGIVVKNAVIMVDKINLNLNVGIPFVESIVDAAKSRLEAIFLTSICTIIGMVPITVENETWQGLGASLIFGLSASTLLTLFVVPTLFYLLVKSSNKKDVRLRELIAQEGK